MALLDTEVKKLESRNSAAAVARVKELKRDLKKKEQEAGASLPDLKHSLHVIRHGEIEAERAKKDLVEANLALGGFGGEKVRQSWLALARSHSRRQYRLNARGR